MNSSPFINELVLPKTPYKGLMPYDEGDAPFFFGREQERKIITANLIASRFTLLYGPSGVGKSSVLRAGVAHHLHTLALQNMKSRGKPRQAVVVFKEWRNEPLTALLNEIESAVRKVLKGREVKTPPSTFSFEEKLKAWSEQVEGKLYIILDQFEEYFLYPQKEGKGSFAYEFPRAVNNPGLRVNFLVSLRDDWLSKLDRFKNDIPSLFDNYLRIERLNPEAAKSAIENPIVKYNELRHEKGLPPAIIEEGFSARVINQLSKLADENIHGVSGQGVAHDEGQGAVITETGIQTPYLQLVLKRLWDEAAQQEPPVLQVKMLDDPERARKIVQSHVDEVMESLEEEERRDVAKVFYHLVTPSGTKIAQKAADLAVFAGVPESEMVKVLDRLTEKESGILTQVAPAPGQKNEPRYEIAHDVLAHAVLAWTNEQDKAEAGRLAAQEAAEREEQARIELKHAQELAEAQRQRAEEQQLYLTAERRRARQFKIGLFIVSALLILMIGVTGYAVKVRNEAHAAKDRAEGAEKTADIARQQAEGQNLVALESAKNEKQAKDEAITARGIADAALITAQQEKEKAQTAARTAEIAKQLEAKHRQLADQKAAEALEAKNKAEEALRADKLYRNAFFLSRGNNKQKALQSLDDAREIYEALGKDSKQAKLSLKYADEPTMRGAQVDTLLIKGGIYLDLSEIDRASSSFSAALKLDQEAGDKFNEAGTLYDVATIYRNQSNLSSGINTAIEYYQKTLAAIREANKPDSEEWGKLHAATLHSLGRTYEKLFDGGGTDKQERFQDADTCYQQAVQLYHDLGDQTGEAGVLFDRGVLYQKLPVQQGLTKTIDFFNQALKLYKSSNNLEGVVVTLKWLAYAYQDAGDVPKVIAAYEEAAEGYEKLGDPKSQVSYLSSIAALYFSNKNGLKAADYFQRVLKMFREIDLFKEDRTKAEEIEMLVNIGKSYSLANEHEKANAFYSEATLIVQQTGNPDLEATTLMNIGGYLIAFNQREEGMRYLDRGAGLYRKSGDLNKLGSQLRNIGERFFRDNPQIAILFFNRALEVFQEAGDRPNEADIYGRLGDAYASPGSTDSASLNKAVEYYERAAQVYLQINMKNRAASEYGRISDLYEVRGNPEKANEYRQKASTVLR